MKELLKANARQLDHINALWHTLVTAHATQHILESNPDSGAKIEIAEFVRILHGAAGGLYNELAHPLIAKAQEKVTYFRATDKKMRAAAQKTIDEARNCPL